jgi:WD40 repeat protein
VDVMPDGQSAVCASEDKTLRVWYLTTGRLKIAFSADAALQCCAVAPDGKTIMAGDYLGAVHFLEWAIFD